MTRTAAVVGAGLTVWGRREATWKDLAQEAGKATFDDVDGLGPDDVEGLFVEIYRQFAGDVPAARAVPGPPRPASSTT